MQKVNGMNWQCYSYHFKINEQGIIEKKVLPDYECITINTNLFRIQKEPEK